MTHFVKLFLRGTVFFFLGTALMTLFLFSLLEGLQNHFNRNLPLTLVYYFLAVFSFIAAFVLYLEAKQMFYFAKLSK